MKKILLFILTLSLLGTASALLLPNRTLPNSFPDGSLVSNVNLDAVSAFSIDRTTTWFDNENMNINNIYYKVVVPEDDIDQWNLSTNFMERKPTAILKPFIDNGVVRLTNIYGAQFVYVYACCNIIKGDILYTANASNPDGSFNITLAGTLTNNYNQNWKSRVYNSTESAWGNANIGKATKPDAYNRRAILESDGVVVGYAMESVNVTMPTLIKIYKI